MSLRALNWAFDVNHDEMTSTHKLVLITLANYSNARNETYPRQATIAAKVKLSRPTVNKALGELAKFGLIQKTSRTHVTGAFRSSIYKLLIPGPADEIYEDMEVDDSDVSNNATRDDDSMSNNATRPVSDDDIGCQNNRQGVSATTTEGVSDDDTFNRVLEPNLEPNLEPKSKKRRKRGPAAIFPEDAYDQFWKLYPNKVGGKENIRPKFQKIADEGNVEFSEIMEGLRLYLNKDDFRDWCMPATWLNQERWTDRPKQKPRGAPSGRWKRGVAI